MHGEYFDHNSVQDTQLYYFDANTYDGDHDFKIDNFFSHADTLQVQDRDNNTFPSKLVKILERDVEPKERNHHFLRPLFGW